MEMLKVSIENFIVCFGDDIESTVFHLLANFTHNLHNDSLL